MPHFFTLLCAPWPVGGDARQVEGRLGKPRTSARIESPPGFQLADDAEAAIRLEDYGPGLAQAGDAADAEGGEDFSLRDAGLSHGRMLHFAFMKKQHRPRLDQFGDTAEANR